jgi:integrase
LDQAFERYMASKTHKATTAKDYRTLWRLHVPTRLKQRPIGEVSPIDVERLRDVIGAKAQRTANKVVGLIGAVMSKSGRWADNPARGVGRFNEEVRTRRLSREELKRLWAALDADAGMWADFFKLLVLTGARRSALCAMRWEDLDLETGLWTVPATWSKNGRELAIPLTLKAVQVLSLRRSTRSNSRWVWPSDESATGHVVNPEKPWRRFLVAADITVHTTLHDIRRTLGSQLARSGAASATITRALGHLSSQSARAYVHLDAAPVRSAIEKVYGELGDA